MTTVAFHVPVHTEPGLTIQLSADERLYQLAADHDESRVFAVYHAVTRHLRGGGQHRLSNRMVANMTPGCGVGKARDCLALLCKAGLLAREGDANSAYFYRLPDAPPPLHEVQQVSPRNERCTPHVQQAPRSVASLEEEKEDIYIDRDNEKSVDVTPTNEQARIARDMNVDPATVAKAAALKLEQVQAFRDLAQQRTDTKEGRAKYFAKCVHNPAPAAGNTRTTKPTAPAPPTGPGKYAAFVAVRSPSPAPTAARPPNGPIIWPKPAPPPPPPDPDDVAEVRTYCQRMMDRMSAPLLDPDRATITRDGNRWVITGHCDLRRHERDLRAWIADVTVTDREAVTVVVEATS